MKISNNFTVTKIMDKYCVLPLGQLVIDTDSVYKLNDSGAFILECLKQDCSEDELFKKICEKYKPENNEEKEICKNDMIKFLSSAKAEGIIVE